MIKTGKNWGATTAEKGSLFLISVFYLSLVLRFAVHPTGLGPLGVENSHLPRFLPPEAGVLGLPLHSSHTETVSEGNWKRGLESA